jgi:hypothetical protein
MTKRSDRRPENLVKLDGDIRRRLTSEDRACGFHQGQSTTLTNRPVIVKQSDLPSTAALPLQERGSPYSGALRRGEPDAESSDAVVAASGNTAM